MHEQAQAAAAIAAVNGLNVIIAPLFVTLYEWFHPGPFLLNAVILAGMMVYALKNTILRAAGETGDADEEATLAILERSDEGGV
jgi:hypothetical protein